MAMTPDELIDTSMMLIVHSGDARAAAFHALQADEGNGEGPQVTLLLVHAQDHLMTSMLAQELIEELIDLHEKKADKE